MLRLGEKVLSAAVRGPGWAADRGGHRSRAVAVPGRRSDTPYHIPSAGSVSRAASGPVDPVWQPLFPASLRSCSSSTPLTDLSSTELTGWLTGWADEPGSSVSRNSGRRNHAIARAETQRSTIGDELRTCFRL